MAAAHHDRPYQPPPCAPGACEYRPTGYHVDPRVGLDCDTPMRWQCHCCRATTARACRAYRESVCRPCAGRYRRAVRAVAHSGMVAQRSSRGFLYLLTLTAPGERAHSLPGGQMCRCTPVGGVHLADWNASHSQRWNQLRTNLRRDHEGLEFMRGVEVQTRGALHDHAMIWSPTALVLSEVRGRAMDAGFGHSVDLASCEPGSRKAAYYVAKYVTKACDARGRVPWSADVVDLATGIASRMTVPGRYRTWSCSRGWGLRMADVRATALAYARGKALERRDAQDAEALAVLGTVLGRLDPVADSPG